MSWFGARPGKRPASGSGAVALVSELEGFGRFTFDPQNQPLPGDLEFRGYQCAQVDRNDFLRQMAEAATTNGGFTAIGAERLVVSVIGGDLPDQEYDTLMRAARIALQGMNCWPARATGYEHGWAMNQPR